MTILFLQGNSGSPGSVTSTTLAYNSAVTAGSTLVCAVRVGQLSVTSPAMSDNVNGTWATVQQQSDSNSNCLVVGYFQNTAAGTPTVTFSYSSTAGSVRIAILEYGGTAASSVDQFQLQTTATTSTPATPSVTTTSAVEMLIAIQESNNAGVAMSQNASGSVPASGWTNRFSVDTGHLTVDDVVVTSTGTYNETWTDGNGADNFATAILTLKAPVGAVLSIMQQQMILM